MGGCEASITIDGTDMPVQHKWDRRFMSHKFGSNGLKYEIGVCIQSGNIVWINGPFRGGEHDITIARQAVLNALEHDEMCEADGGYKGEPYKIKTPKAASTAEESYMKTIARSRHETANKRFKIFEILKKRYRHALEKHSACFRAVAVVTQLSIEYGHPLYEVEYYDMSKTNEDLELS